MISLFTARSFAPPLAEALRHCRPHLVQAAIFSALLNLLYLAPSLYLLSVYDRVVPTRAVQTLAMLTAIYVFAVATLGALDWLRSSLLIRSAARLDRLLAGNILAALLAAPDPSGRQSGAVLRDFDTFRQTMTGPSAIAFFDLPWSPIYILVCFVLHPLIGLFALACSALLVAVALLNERSIAPSLSRALLAQQRAYQSIEASLRTSGVVRALGMERGLIARHLRERAEATATQASTAFVSARLVTVTKVARIAMQSFALGLGALLAIEQQISAGAIFAAALLVSRALAPLESVTAAWRNTVQVRVAIDSLNAAFAERGAARAATLLPAPVGRLEIERLSVALPDREGAVLHDIGARIEPGEMVGIIGPSGAGKSTLLRAMAGELVPAAGQIRLDGAALGDWRPEQRTAAIGYLPQAPSLLHGSIKDNIARFHTETAADPALIDRNVVDAARLCDAHDFILRLPMAYDTIIHAEGAGLSIGQAQRIALARALFGKPEVLLLDEPNAHLDAEGEMQLVATLARLKRDKVTIVIVAHRLQILEGSDKLLVLRGGKLEGFGSSKDIIRRFGVARPTAVASTPGSGP